MQTAEAFLPTIRLIARKFVRRHSWMELDEAINAGIIGFYAAAPRFDASKGADFSTYVTHRVRGSMMDAARKQSGKPRLMEVYFVEYKDADTEADETLMHSDFLERLKLRQHVSSLSGTARTTIIAHYFHDQSITEIGAFRGVTAGAASINKRDGLEQLRMTMGGA